MFTKSEPNDDPVCPIPFYRKYLTLSIDGPNVYGYVKGNPVSRIDRLGLWWDQVIRDGITVGTTDWKELNKCLKQYTTKRRCLPPIYDCTGMCGCFGEAGLLKNAVGLGSCITTCETGLTAKEQVLFSGCGKKTVPKENRFTDIILVVVIVVLLRIRKKKDIHKKL